MDTRTILTSPPVQSCDVCERRLLRGEHPEVFLSGGQRRTVCELCAPRALHGGWVREREIDRLAPAEPRERQPGGILQRLRRAGQRRPAPGRAGARAEQDEADAMAPIVVSEPAFAADEDPTAEPALAPGLLELGAIRFNESEFPRRVRGLVRSLGQPAVSIRRAEHLDSAVRIVIAWELCWYRYEIDFAEAQPTVAALEQGSELSQLAREERDWNALLDGQGLLALASPA